MAGQVIDNQFPKKTSKALIAYEDPVARLALFDIFTEAGYHVIESGNGKSALDIFLMETIDLVITDVHLPGMSGIQLVHSIKSTGNSVPILIVNSSLELSDGEALALGAKGIINKPFNKDEILAIAQRVNPFHPVTPPEDLTEQFSRLSIEDYISGNKIQYDIYIRLSNYKFLKIAYQGADISLDRLEGYKSKGIRFLYMRKEDFAKYLGFNIKLFEAANKDPKVPKEKKLGLLKHTGDLLAQQIRLDGMNESAFEQSKVFVETSVGLLSSQDDVWALLESLSKEGDFIYTHSVAVSTISVLIAKEMKWHSPQNLLRIGMGGLFHDIGKREIDLAILQKPRRDLTANEIKIVESHPQRGAEILGKIRNIPEDLIQIILQHHENCIGQGYPKGLRKNEIHPLARLVAVADEFCNLAFKVPGGPLLTPQRAVQNLIDISYSLFDPRFIHALAHIFNVSVPDNKKLRE